MSKFIVFKVRDDSIWGIPAEVVANNRAKYYASKENTDATYEAVYRDEFDMLMSDDLELTDWAGNNMDWEDIKPHLVQIKEAYPINDRDFKAGWDNAVLATIEKEVSKEE